MLEWILLACKIIGLIGAFAGFSGEAPATGRGRHKRLWAISFLSVAIGAEFVDSLLKRQDSREQAVRFERLAHPLGPISVGVRYSLSFAGDEFKTFRARFQPVNDLDEFNPPPLPDPHKEGNATALFAGRPDVYMFFSRVPGPGQEADLSFPVALYDDVQQDVFKRIDSSAQLRQIAEQRQYSYQEGTIYASSHYVTNNPDDRYSNGSIISTVDLAGAELEIRFCPIVSWAGSSTAALSQRMHMESISIGLPGHQGFELSVRDTPGRTGKTLRVRQSESAHEHCEMLFYDFPADPLEFNKLVNPPD
jgi:hypothetical protein